MTITIVQRRVEELQTQDCLLHYCIIKTYCYQRIQVASLHLPVLRRMIRFVETLKRSAEWIKAVFLTFTLL